MKSKLPIIMYRKHITTSRYQNNPLFLVAFLNESNDLFNDYGLRMNIFNKMEH